MQRKIHISTNQTKVTRGAVTVLSTLFLCYFYKYCKSQKPLKLLLPFSKNIEKVLIHFVSPYLKINANGKLDDVMWQNHKILSFNNRNKKAEISQ